MKKTIVCLVLFVFVASAAFGDFLWFSSRNPKHDIARAAGRSLSKEENEIADVTMAFYYVKYGYAVDGVPLKDALKRMTKDEYNHAVKQAAKIATSDGAKGALKLGKAGEKLLKAILITFEDAAQATGKYIDKKAADYDKKK